MNKSNFLPLEEVTNDLLKDDEAKFYYKMYKREHELKKLLLLARENAQLTQKELARKLNVHVSSVSRLENNPLNATMEKIDKYLSACNAKIEFILR